MEERAKAKRKARGKATNDIYLNEHSDSAEESKYKQQDFRTHHKRRLASSDSNNESFVQKSRFSPHHRKNNSIDANKLAGEGTVFKENGKDKIFVIKDNGLVIWMNEPDLKTVTKDIRSIPFTVKDPTSSIVTLLKSQFKGRTETFYFPYPDFCIEEKEESSRVIRIDQNDFTPLRAYFRYDTNAHIYNAIVRAWNEAGLFLKNKSLLTKYRLMQLREKKEKSTDEKVYSEFSPEEEKLLKETDDDLLDKYQEDYNVRFMVTCKKEDLESVRKNQKLNHFPQSYYLGRKDQLYRNYQIQEELFPSDYNFMVKTFIFPYDAKKFEVHKSTSISPRAKKKLWIFKPSASSCGRGIKIIDSKTVIPENSKGFLISEYIQNPHLIKGFKYDLRIYVLVTNYDPLTVYIYNDGLIRFCTVKYKNDDANVNNKLMHISNYSIQKESKKYKHNNDASEDSSKWNFTMWEEAIREQGHDVKIAQLKIEDMVIKTLIGVQDTISTAYDSMTGIRNAWFELYGFDIMFDDHMNPWLLEINTNPSLSSNSTLDKMLKTKLAWDMLTLVGIKIMSFSELRIQEKKEGKVPLRPNDYEGWETHEDRNKRRTKLMNSINFKNLSEEDIDIILTLEEEYKRMGNFRRIFPNKNNFRDYTKYFYKHSYNNLLVWKYLKATKFDLSQFSDKKFL